MLYHATFSELPLGEPIAPAGPTNFYPLAVDALEGARPDGCPSRSSCVFASDNLAGATKFAQSQYPHAMGPLRVYIVEMPIFHRSPMRIVHALEEDLRAGLPTTKLVDEYWRPTGTWIFCEYFGPSLTPIEEIQVATDGEIMVFDSRYFSDGDRVRHLRSPPLSVPAPVKNLR